MNRKTIQRMGLICVGIGAVILPLTLGCATPFAGTATESGATLTNAGTTEKGAAELWTDNCQRCHSMRSPGSYSDAEWQIAVHHMRIVANLTAKEHKAILQFLKAGN